VATTTLLALAATTLLPTPVAADEAMTSMSSTYRPRRLRAAPSRQLQQEDASASSSPPNAADLCVAELDWTSEGGEILVNGQPLHLKGTSYFGFETPNEGTLVSKPTACHSGLPHDFWGRPIHHRSLPTTPPSHHPSSSIPPLHPSTPPLLLHSQIVNLPHFTFPFQCAPSYPANVFTVLPSPLSLPLSLPPSAPRPVVRDTRPDLWLPA
jgi:hypothetical protein